MTRKGWAILAVSGLTLAGVAAYAANEVHDGRFMHRMGGMHGMHGAGAMFDRFDADEDGFVTRDEIVGRRAARFAEADADGDGAVSYDELKAAMTRAVEEHAKKIMAMADADGDGFIREGEFAHRREGGGRHLDRLFENLDADGDGMISRDEADQMRHRFRHGRDAE